MLYMCKRLGLLRLRAAEISAVCPEGGRRGKKWRSRCIVLRRKGTKSKSPPCRKVRDKDGAPLNWIGAKCVEELARSDDGSGFVGSQGQEMAVARDQERCVRSQGAFKDAVVVWIVWDCADCELR